MQNIKQSFKTVILLTLISSVFLISGYFLGGQSGLFISLIISLAFNFGSYFFSHKVILSMHRAKELNKSHKLYVLVNNISQNAQIPTPKVYLYENTELNAFATGRDPKNGVVALSTGLVNRLDQEELKGVIAHELAHIKNRDVLIATISATIATAISYLGNFIFFSPNQNDEEGGTNPIYTIFLIFVAPIIASLIQFSISRSREYIADSTGAKIAQSPNGLISALEKISQSYSSKANNTNNNINKSMSHMYIFNPFNNSNLTKIFSTHPPVEERIKKLKKYY